MDANPNLRPSVSERKAGEQFNPWRRTCGFYPPDVVARQGNLKDGPKRLYERLVRWAGRNEACWYGFERMALELGKCVRQVKLDIVTLERYGLVKHRRRGKGSTNFYTFLWHPIFNDVDVCRLGLQEDSPFDQGSEVHTDAHHNHGEEVQLSAGDGQAAASGDGQRAAHEFCNENFAQGNESSSADCQAEVLTAEVVDDDPSSKETANRVVSECLIAFVKAFGITMPVGQMPVTEIANGLGHMGATIGDLVEFLKNYSAQWRGAPATWKHVLVSFENWAADPKTAQSIAWHRLQEEREERQRQARIKRERAMATPVI